VTSARGQLKRGDVFEIRTDKGLAYVQYTHDHKDLGPLVRVLPGMFSSRPDNLKGLVVGPTRFVVFYPIVDAARRSLAQLIGSFPIPNHADAFPLMKWVKPKLDGTLEWSLWDGRTHVRDGIRSLSHEEMDLPDVTIFNHDYLLERLVSDWSWRQETERELADAANSVTD
jgi:hypothetical protein